MINFDELDTRIEALSPGELAEMLRDAMKESGMEDLIQDGSTNVFASWGENHFFDYIVEVPEKNALGTVNYKQINSTTEWLTGNYKDVGEFHIHLLNKAG